MVKNSTSHSAQVIIIGGGLAGLVSAIRMARSGLPCLLLEKKQYPFHRVCGEYVSNETLSFLTRENLFPTQFQLPAINEFQLSSVSGKLRILPLDLGGFGISRYAFDNYLHELAIQAGVEVIQQQEVDKIEFIQKQDQFVVSAGEQRFTGSFAIGSFGKRSKLDNQLNRKFMGKRSPYVAVKYHVRTEHPSNRIALHNFNGGYCGLSNIEDGKTNLCYLVHREQVKRFKDIDVLEENILFKNPLLKSVFSNADFLFDKPEIINEVSFDTKEPVLNHILMTGDAAGMIAPLCGNGMAMAIHSGKIASDLIVRAVHENRTRDWVEQNYSLLWNKAFAARLRFGRFIQNNLFGTEWSSRVAINLTVYLPPLARFIIRKTHGESF